MCAGTDGGPTVARVRVNVDAVIIVGSERIDDVGDDIKLGEVEMCEEKVASVDDFRSVVLKTASGCTKFPGSSVKRVFWQHPAPASSVPSGAPQHQLWAVKEPLFTGHGYMLLKLSIAAVIASARSMCGVDGLGKRGVSTAYNLCTPGSSSAIAM